MKRIKLFLLTFFCISLFEFSLSSQVIIQSHHHKTFYTSQGKLYDCKGNEFIMRGVNNPHIWFKGKAMWALDDIAGYKSNTVRVVWQTKGSAKDLRKILSRVVELKMVAIPELHDFTGNNDIDAIEKAARYWAREDIKKVLDEFQPYILINIANEWMGKLDSITWLNGYKSAVKIMRDAGLIHCIVIDGAGWGQNIDVIKNHAKDLLELDPDHNLLFDIHMYGSWNDPEKITSELNYIIDNKIPLLVGEFGYHYNEGKNNLGCKVDAPHLLKTCQQLGIGYLAWSWCGNDKENKWLDLAEKWKTLTPWGETVINGQDGIIKTSQPCSIFKE